MSLCPIVAVGLDLELTFIHACLIALSLWCTRLATLLVSGVAVNPDEGMYDTCHASQEGPTACLLQDWKQTKRAAVETLQQDVEVSRIGCTVWRTRFLKNWTQQNTTTLLNVTKSEPMCTVQIRKENSEQPAPHGELGWQHFLGQAPATMSWPHCSAALNEVSE
eukprot:1520074-Amphidinium_carterae.1